MHKVKQSVKYAIPITDKKQIAPENFDNLKISYDFKIKYLLIIHFFQLYHDIISIFGNRNE